MANTISAVIHTLNEQDNIKDCLESIKWVDEIIIIDMGSEDKTLEIAKEYNAKIYFQQKVRCVDMARNFGLSKVTSAWTLVVDADELIPEKLKNAILDFITDPKYINALAFPRKNIFFGEWAKCYFPDYQIRFFKTGIAEWDGRLHHPPKINGKINTFPPDPECAIIHYSFDTISDNLRRLDDYGYNYARDLIEQNIKFPYDLIVNRFRKLLYDRLKQLENFKETPHEFFVRNLCWFSDIVYQAKWWEQTKFLPDLEEKPPTCSIIILCHNKLPLTMQCLEALQQNTEDIDCEVIVIDNASTDNTYDCLIAIPWIKPVRNTENIPFAKANNQIAQIARGEYLLFLNNDTIPQKSWLTEMLKLYKAKPDAGIVGSKLLFPNTKKIQHAGVVFSPDLTPLVLYIHHDEHAPEVNKVRELNAVIGACLLIKKDLFFDVGMFDENYINHREDSDLCLKVKEKGFKVYYCPSSVLYHYSRTTENFHEDEHNLKYFKEKWKDKIKSDAQEIVKEDGYEFICEKGKYRLTLGNASKSLDTFEFNGNTYKYFHHPYNNTVDNERAVEIPIVWGIVQKYPDKNILEIGNVISNYFHVNYDIVDKYEKSKGVINKDILDFKPDKKYDLIVSISTFEHIGWHEDPKEGQKKPNKIFDVIKYLKTLLTEDGKIVITVPIGQNPYLDNFLKQGKIPFAEQYYIKRTEHTKWIQANWDDISDSKYGKPYPYANAIVIGIIENRDPLIQSHDKSLSHDIGGTQPCFDEKFDISLSQNDIEIFPVVQSITENTKKRLLVVTRYHRFKKGWSITMDKIYKTDILQQDFEIYHLAWHAKKDEFIDGIHIYAEPELTELNRLEETIILSNPDVILLHADPHFFPCYYKTLKVWEGPILGWFPVDGESTPNTWQSILEVCTKLLSLTNYGKRELESKDGAKGKKVITVNLGVDNKVFQPATYQQKRIYRQDFGVPDNAVVYLTVANNFWRKGVYLAVEAFGRLVNQYSLDDVFLYLYTNMDKPLYNLINGKPAIKNKISYPTGYNPFYNFKEDIELVKYYQLADIFFLPTMAEGFGMPLLEAQACGLPCIASNNSAIPEVVGGAGLLIDSPSTLMGLSGDYYVTQHPPRIEHAVELMYQLYKDKELRQNLGEIGIKHAAELTWERAAEELKKVCNSVILEPQKIYEFKFPEPEVIKV